MPVSRVRPHVAASHSSLTPQMVGDPLRASTSSSSPYPLNKVKRYGDLVNAKKASLAAAAHQGKSTDTVVSDASDVQATAAAVEQETTTILNQDEPTESEVIIEEKETQLVSVNALYGSWYNNMEHIEIKHMVIFNPDNTGSLKSQGNVDGIGARLVNFRYTLAEDRCSLELQYLPLSPKVTNPFEVAKYLPADQIPLDKIITLPFKVFESLREEEDTYSFLAPSGKIYEPTLAIQFEQSPWPLDMFPTRNRYYGALRRVRANKMKLARD